MSDAQGENPIKKTNDGAEGNESDSKKTQAQAPNFDPVALGDDDFQKVFEDPRLFQHPRFKELNERAKLAAKLQQEQEKAENEKLKQEKKWQELAEKSEAKATELQTRLQETLIDSKIVQKALELGALDTEAVTKLITRTGISVDDSGNATGIDEALASLKDGKGYLFGSGAPRRIGSPSNPTADANQNAKKFTLSQIQDPAFYKDNEQDILAAFATGNITDDSTR